MSSTAVQSPSLPPHPPALHHSPSQQHLHQQHLSPVAPHDSSNDDDDDNDDADADVKTPVVSAPSAGTVEAAGAAAVVDELTVPMSITDLGFDFEVKEQDRWLPIANVARIMKTALPENAKIAKEAKECMQECVSEFISFITSEASEKCQQEKRKTVNGEDILFAMTSLGFENYGEALKIYLTRYRESLVARGDGKLPASGGSGTGASASPPTYQGPDAHHHALSAHSMNAGVGTGDGGDDFPYGGPAAGEY